MIYAGGGYPGLYSLLTEGEAVAFSDDGFIGLAWVEFTTKDDVVHVWSTISIDDPSTYYHGFKDARILSWGRITRALSEFRTGQMEGGATNFRASDNDRVIRALLSADATKYFVNRPLVFRMIDDESRRQQLVPRTVMRGLISGYRPEPKLEFSFSAEDVITRKFVNNGVEIPKRRIRRADFPGVDEQLIGLAVPFIYGSVSDLTLVSDPLSDITGLEAAVTGGGDSNHKPLATVVAELQASHDTGTLYEDWGNKIGYGDAIVLQGLPSVPTDYFDLANVIGYADLNFLLSGEGQTNRYGVTAVNAFGRETKPTYIDVPGAPVDAALDASRFVHLTWNAMPGATGFKIYGRLPGPSYFLSSDVQAGASEYFDGKKPDGTARVDTPDPTRAAPLSNQTSIENDAGFGVVLPMYMGVVSMAGKEWHEFLIAGHACKEIEGWYVEGVRQAVSTESASGPFLMPGYAGYQAVVGADPFVDRNGRRYSLCYILKGDAVGDEVADGVKRFTLNVSGIEDVGDGSGTLLTDIFAQYKHMMINWVLGDYQSGAWGTEAPTYPDATTSQLNDASFDAASLIAAERIAGGYVGSGVAGSGGELLRVRDFIAQWNLSADCDSGFNRDGQFFVSIFSETSPTQEERIVLTDVESINKDTFDVYDDLDSHFNDMPYYWARDYTGRVAQAWLGIGRLGDETSQGNYEATLTAPSLFLEFVRDDDTALDIVSRRMLRMKDPPRMVRVTTGLRGANYELGDVVLLTHYGGVGAAGWINQPLRILRHDLDPDKYTVTLTCMDMKQLFAFPFILGDETALAADWTSATAADKLYGYLADEVTGQFSDGEPGKRLR